MFYPGKIPMASPGIQDKEFRLNEKTCVWPQQDPGKTKAVLLKLNVHTDHLGSRL